MGYDLHITRKANWSNETGPSISEAEWKSVIYADPELSLDTETKCMMADGEFVFAVWNGRAGALGYYGGEITAKNPDRPLIAKMAHLARALNAKVQGDDGEIYRQDGTSIDAGADSATLPRRGILSRMSDWLGCPRTTAELSVAAPSFQIGQRVRTSFGDLGTVLQVDCKANSGLGSVRIRLSGKWGRVSFY